MLDVDHGIWFLVVSCMEKVTSTCLYVGYFICFFFCLANIRAMDQVSAYYTYEHQFI